MGVTYSDTVQHPFWSGLCTLKFHREFTETCIGRGTEQHWARREKKMLCMSDVSATFQANMCEELRVPVQLVQAQTCGF